MELQKERFLEGLTAKYWNSSANSECSTNEDNEGITLESLGGVFIATLFGLALAMLTLAGEVLYYRVKSEKLHKNKKVKAAAKKFLGKAKISALINELPPPAFEKTVLGKNKTIARNILGVDQQYNSTKFRRLGGSVNFIPLKPNLTILSDEPPHYIE